jgi:hypothetical protein
MAYRDYCFELTGTIPGLPFPLAQTLINRAWKDIRDLRLWSWLVDNADIEAPNLISAGTVSVTQNQNIVQMDAAAAAALAPFQLSNPPLASPTLGVGRQIRIGLTGSGGPIYSIISADFNANTLTLDRNYADVSGVSQPYQVYKCYYAAPATDFLRYFTITNMASGYSIRGKKLYYTQQKLNAIDAQRGGTGDAYIISAYKGNATGQPVHEWYPHPVNARTYNCIFQHRGIDLSDSVDIPSTLPSSILMAKAFSHAAIWAQANVGRYSELAQVNWVMYKQGVDAQFKEEVIQAIKQDDEISPLTPFLQGSYFDFPLGGEFLQGHDVSSLIGDAT